MAEIDKPLPNVDIKDEAFVETEVETPIEENVKNEDVEVTMDEEGGAEISLIQPRTNYNLQIIFKT